ncbi:MAG: M56 family metallopeptidase [Anaerolineales bacterium]|nr:M56 family metallopeptidase [Anaerolineales bacterium]
MIRKTSYSFYFWLLIGLSTTLIWLGLFFSFDPLYLGLEALWQTCHSGWRYLIESPPLTRQMIIPLVVLTILIRTGWSLVRQIRATQRMAHLFLPLHAEPPARVQALLAPHQLGPKDIIFLNTRAVHAFCLGFWRPRMWLTAGLVDLLADDELAAVLAHEMRHLRQRDPLRRLIGRALQSAFFFLPVIKSLAEATELQQEIDADRHAITHLGDDLPLLCALQKLLKHGHTPAFSAVAAFTLFNPTEARLKTLIYPPAPVNWPKLATSGLINLAILLALSTTIYTNCTQLAATPSEVGACIVDTLQNSSSSLPLNYYW